jgi:hypothetical protein
LDEKVAGLGIADGFDEFKQAIGNAPGGALGILLAEPMQLRNDAPLLRREGRAPDLARSRFLLASA